MIRNEFENHGHNPLAFHLRCLGDDTEEKSKELNNLIQREIDCRDWFVFCESENSKTSKYVKMEKDYIISKGKTNIWSLNMNDTFDEIAKKIEDICFQISVFVSYSESDTELAEDILDSLEKKDFALWDSKTKMRSEAFSLDYLKVYDKQYSKYGFVLLLITENFIKSEDCIKEAMWVIDKGIKIIPLIFGKTPIPNFLQKHRCYRIPSILGEEDIRLIVDFIVAELRTRIKGPGCQSDAWNKLKEINEKLNYEKRYHSQEAIEIGHTGSSEDYLEIYKFPCCGLTIAVGDGPVSRFRADGCCCDSEG